MILLFISMVSQCNYIMLNIFVFSAWPFESSRKKINNFNSLRMHKNFHQLKSSLLFIHLNPHHSPSPRINVTTEKISHHKQNNVKQREGQNHARCAINNPFSPFSHFPLFPFFHQRIFFFDRKTMWNPLCSVSWNATTNNGRRRARKLKWTMDDLLNPCKLLMVWKMERVFCSLLPSFLSLASPSMGNYESCIIKKGFGSDSSARDSEPFTNFEIKFLALEVVRTQPWLILPPHQSE